MDGVLRRPCFAKTVLVIKLKLKLKLKTFILENAHEKFFTKKVN